MQLWQGICHLAWTSDPSSSQEGSQGQVAEGLWHKWGGMYVK